MSYYRDEKTYPEREEKSQFDGDGIIRMIDLIIEGVEDLNVQISQLEERLSPILEEHPADETPEDVNPAKVKRSKSPTYEKLGLIKERLYSQMNLLTEITNSIDL